MTFSEDYASPPQPSAEVRLLIDISKSLKEILAILKESQNAVKNNIEK
jgi:DNA-binding CsgD family transcriptional regulator